MIIKKLFFSALTLALLAGAATTSQAQSRPQPRKGGVAPKGRVVNANAAVRDGATMKDGKIILTEMGSSAALTADKKLINGTTITPAGLVTRPDGTTTQLAEGDLMSLSGRVTTRRSMVEADSILKIKEYDMKYPGKREKMEKERAAKEKEKKKREEEKAKAEKKKKK